MHKLNPRFFLGLSLGVATLVATATLSGCHSTAQAPASIPDNAGPDPAAANMAPVGNAPPALMAVRGIRSQAQPQQNAEQYPPAGAPTNEAISAAQQAAQQGPPQTDQNYDYNAPDPDFDAGQQALEEADQAPPPLPEYDQPEAPAPNYLWTPGYWSFAPAGYFWVPGAWCAPPFYGALWTPGYWGFFGGRYLFHHGYWGPHIGFYGGINYGFGYVGTGYYGGYWRGHDFFYNRSVNRVNVNITNVYNRTVVVNNRSRVAFNGGRGGINVRPGPAEVAAMRGPRTPAMASQIANRREAQQNHGQFFNQNRGRPAMVAATRPIMADRTPPRPITRPATETNRGGFGGPENRPGLTRPGQPGMTRPTQPGSRPGMENNRPQVQPTRPETRPTPENRPQQQARPSQPENRPAPQQPRTEQSRPEQARPAQPENRPQQPQFRPQPQQSRPAQPQFRPEQPQSRPMPQPAERPTPQSRPAQPQARPMPQPQARPAPQSRPEGGHPR